MCRLYKSKYGDYVRLCYYHDERRGEHVLLSTLPEPIIIALRAGEIRHVPKGKSKSKTPYGLSRTGKYLVRCQKCGAPLNRANYEIGICSLCQEVK